MTAPPTRALRWIPVDEIGVRFNLSPRLVRDCLGAFKRLANSALNKAVREGRVSRPQNCSECQNAGRIEGHHPNYLRWLEVVWLCRTCHSKQPSGSLPRVPVRYVKRWAVKQRDREERYRCLLKTPQTSTVGSRIAGQRVTLRRTVLDVADKRWLTTFASARTTFPPTMNTTSDRPKCNSTFYRREWHVTGYRIVRRRCGNHAG